MPCIISPSTQVLHNGSTLQDLQLSIPRHHYFLDHNGSTLQDLQLSIPRHHYFFLDHNGSTLQDLQLSIPRHHYFFLELQSTNQFNKDALSDQIAMLAIFMPIVRESAIAYKDLWNIHKIRKQRNRPNSVVGQPQVLYDFPPTAEGSYGVARVAHKRAQAISELGGDLLALDWEFSRIASFVGYCMNVSFPSSTRLQLSGQEDHCLRKLLQNTSGIEPEPYTLQCGDVA
jgi:hypothetical protein